jgi:hypothetical protein
MATLADIAAAQEWLGARLAADPKTRNDEPAQVNWTYAGDDHVEAKQPLEALFMGLNPGAGHGATPSKISPSERRWRTNCQKIADGRFNGFVLSELIAIATESQSELVSRFGGLEDLIRLCALVNQKVIEFHKPKIVFQVGLGNLDVVACCYGLTDAGEEVFRANKTQILLKLYSQTRTGIPWVAIKHFSSFGFSKNDRAGIRDFVDGFLGLGDATTLPTAAYDFGVRGRSKLAALRHSA